MKKILVDAVNTFIVDGKIYQPLLNLLEEYSNEKIILTNANDEQITQFGLINLPYELFTLKHNPDKINPEYFNHMLKHFELQPQDVVYFEHNPDAVRSAQSVGITTYHYDPEGKDLVSLQNFLNEKLS